MSRMATRAATLLQGRHDGIDGNVPNVAAWCYADRDIVTGRVPRWLVGSCRKCPGCACSVAWPGCNGMARRPATTARPVVGTKRSAKRGGRLRTQRPSWRSCQRRAPMSDAYRPKPTPSRACGAGRWPRWSSIRARYRATAARPAGPRPPARGQRRGCAGCAYGASQGSLLRVLRSRNHRWVRAAFSLAPAAGGGVLHLVLCAWAWEDAGVIPRAHLRRCPIAKERPARAAPPRDGGGQDGTARPAAAPAVAGPGRLRADPPGRGRTPWCLSDAGGHASPEDRPTGGGGAAAPETAARGGH